jgi:hypothetical protein
VNGDCWIHLPGLASFRFGAGGGGVTALARPSTRREFILDGFYRTVLPIALQALGQEALHASAVLTPRGVLALCGISETGKSTTAFGLSRRGYPLWADDAVAFDTSGLVVRAIPLPFQVRLRPGAAAFFDERDQASLRQPRNHHFVKVADAPAPLAALVVLNRVDPQHPKLTEIARLPPARAFTAVLTHAHCFSLTDLGRKRRMMTHYLDLATRVPVFEVRFQAGLDRLSTILDSIEQAVDQLPVNTV